MAPTSSGSASACCTHSSHCASVARFARVPAASRLCARVASAAPALVACERRARKKQQQQRTRVKRGSAPASWAHAKKRKRTLRGRPESSRSTRPMHGRPTPRMLPWDTHAARARARGRRSVRMGCVARARGRAC
eukprot:7376420-Prymnesium_polylepis.1